MSMTLGIGSYTLPWHVGIGQRRPDSPLSQLELLRIGRHETVQTVQYCENLSLLDLEEEELHALEKEARVVGIRLEVGTRGLHPTNLEAHALLAHRLGSPFVRLVVDSPGDEPRPNEVVERLRPHAALFRELGLWLAIENHDRFTSETLRDMVRALGRDWAGVCLDTANSLGSLENPVETIVTLASDALCLHVKDIVIQREPHMLGFRIYGVPAGQGMINIPATLHALREEGFDGSVILEQWVAPVASMENTLVAERRSMEESLRFLRELF